MRILLLLLVTLPGYSQKLTFGGVVGTNLTDDVRSGTQYYPGDSALGGVTYRAYPGERRLIFGLKAEYELGHHWAIEFNALRREVKRETTMTYERPLGDSFPEFRNKQTLSSGQFPLLAKYRFSVAGLRPFAEGGMSFRTAGSGSGLKHYGVTTGAGLEWMLGGFRLAPTVRYTAWAGRGPGGFPGAAQLNQVEFLLGFDRQGTQVASAFGKRLSIGVLLGFVPGNDFRASSIFCCQVSERNSFVPGIALEARITGGWSIEVDGIYRSLHGWTTEGTRPVRFAHLTWEFPVLGKYHFRRNERWQPFVAAGPSFRAEGNLNLRPVSHVGATMAGGIETSAGWLKIAPQVRYTRWGSGEPNFRGVTQANQVQLFVALRY